MQLGHSELICYSPADKLRFMDICCLCDILSDIHVPRIMHIDGALPC